MCAQFRIACESGFRPVKPTPRGADVRGLIPSGNNTAGGKHVPHNSSPTRTRAVGPLARWLSPSAAALAMGVTLASGWLGCQPSGSADRGQVTSDGAGGEGGAGFDAGSGTGGTATGTGGMGTGGMGTGAGGTTTGTGGMGTGGTMTGTGGMGTGGMGTGGAGTGGTMTGTGGGPVDLAPEVPEVRTALLVVLDPKVLTPGEVKLKGLLEGRNFSVTLNDDDATAAPAAGKTLVVLSSVIVSKSVLAKYKDVPVPVLDLESAVFDDMKMTGAVDGTDFDEEPGNEIVVLPGMQVHPLAANLQGRVTVSAGGPNECCGTNWGKPAPSAVAVAAFATATSGKIAIFGYDRGAKMVDNFVAPARRVGLFAADTTAQYLTPNGISLVNAAIEWAIASD
jgi:hypothetical protein